MRDWIVIGIIYTRRPKAKKLEHTGHKDNYFQFSMTLRQQVFLFHYCRDVSLYDMREYFEKKFFPSLFVNKRTIFLG